MRTSLGSTWFLQLMILFILIFAAYIILTLNYSRTIKVKNEVVSIIEKYEGLNTNSLTLINDFLKNNRYETTGECTAESTTGLYGALSLEDASLEKAEEHKEYYYCVKKFKGANTSNYYQVTLFYEFNLPVIGNTGGFYVRGTTSNFYATDNRAYAGVIGG